AVLGHERVTVPVTQFLLAQIERSFEMLLSLGIFSQGPISHAERKPNGGFGQLLTPESRLDTFGGPLEQRPHRDVPVSLCAAGLIGDVGLSQEVLQQELLTACATARSSSALFFWVTAESR